MKGLADPGMDKGELASVISYLDNYYFDHDSHHLIEYTASKENDKIDLVSVTKNAEDSTYYSIGQ